MMLPFRVCLFLSPSVCLSVCLSRSRIVLKAQTADDIDTISFTYDSPMSLQDRVKIWLTSVNPVLIRFCPEVVHPAAVDVSVTHSMANFSQLVGDNAMVTMESL